MYSARILNRYVSTVIDSEWSMFVRVAVISGINSMLSGLAHGPRMIIPPAFS